MADASEMEIKEAFNRALHLLSGITDDMYYKTRRWTLQRQLHDLVPMSVSNS